MFKKLAICALAALFSVSLLCAHGNATHLMGTVTAVGKDTVTIKDKDGKPIVVMLAKSTKYFKNKKAMTIGDLQVGARVVIDAEMDEKMKMYSAEEIQLSNADSGAAAAAKPASPAKK